MPKLTKTAIDAIKTPASGDTWVWCSDLEGFGVRVQASGRRTYVVRYRTKDAARTQRKMTLCRCSDTTPDKARQLARDVFFSVASGDDPAVNRRTRHDAPTIEAMFRARVAAMREAGRENAGEVERVLLTAAHNAADAFGRNKAPADVKPDDVIRFVSHHFHAGHRGAADKARGYVSAAFAWAIKSANDYTVAQRQDWGLTSNPAAAIARDHGAATVRDRHLDAAEIRAVWNGDFGDISPILQLMICCGQRVRETLQIDGSEIDLQAAVWRMPAHKTKGRKRPHTIPLPAVAVPILRELIEHHGDGPLFPSRGGAARDRVALLSVSQAVRRWCAMDGCTVAAFQPRDLRRTWKSRTHDAGVDRFTRDLIQQHAQGDTGSKHYDRAEYTPQMRAAMDKWSAWLSAVIAGHPGVRLVA